MSACGTKADSEAALTEGGECCTAETGEAAAAAAAPAAAARGRDLDDDDDDDEEEEVGVERGGTAEATVHATDAGDAGTSGAFAAAAGKDTAMLFIGVAAAAAAA